MSSTLPEPIPAPDRHNLHALVDQWGLTSSTARQPIGRYIRELWTRRDFIVSLADSTSTAQYSDTLLGRFWQVLAPILNAIVYFFVFGLLLNTSKGIENYVAFLVAGVFTFTYTQRAVTGGAKSIANNRPLIRAIHFPRAVLPLAVIVQEIQQQIVSLVILCGIVLLTGEPLSWHWLGVIPVMALQTMFNAGLCMLVARWTAASQDVTQLIPFVMTSWRYVSGVFYSIYVFTESAPAWVRDLLFANPATVYIELVRVSLMTSHSAPASLWWYAAAWGIGTLVVGFVVFHRGEESYARG
jgi:teichoic acid transport system permease protein